MFPYQTVHAEGTFYLSVKVSFGLNEVFEAYKNNKITKPIMALVPYFEICEIMNNLYY